MKAIVLFATLVAVVLSQQSCVTKMDLVMVLDHSCSIDDNAWKLVENFAQQIVNNFDVGPNTAQFGCVQFANTAPSRLEFGLLSDKQTILKKLTNISRIGCGTDIARGLVLGRTELQQHGRKDAVPVILMMTDGKQSVPGDPQKEADLTKASNIEIFVIGVGNQINPASLKTIASAPPERHLFFADTFNQLQQLLQTIINSTCLHVKCPNISPNYGPPEGGTVVTIVGEGFKNGPNIACMFGTKVVPAVFVDSTHITCKSPPGVKGSSVVLEITMDGKTYTTDSCLFSYSQFKPDPCAQWGQNCSYCISHAFCGWCSSNVTHTDGTLGSQCAGFNHGNNSDEQSFVCTGTYHTQECVPGYRCDRTTATCKLVEPGNGDLRDTCLQNCGVGSIYSCQNSNNTCMVCPDGTPGCVSHTDCFQLCHIPNPGPEVPPTDGVPGPLVNTIWRGLQIHKGYAKGEYRMRFGTDIAQFRDPSGAVIEATVQTTPNELWFTFKSGPAAGNTVRAIYDVQYVGQVVAMTLANGPPGGRVPQDFDESMTLAAGFTEYEWLKCLNPATCTFFWEDQRRSVEADDYCKSFVNCSACVAQPTCGWCSNNVIYDDGTIGLNCAGYDPNGSRKPFVCRGTFATDSCDHVVPPQTWRCDPSTKRCVEGPEGSGTDYPTCNATCGHVPPPPVPVVPQELRGTWRGMQINSGYKSGEWKAEFGDSAVAVYAPNGDVLISGNVYSTEDQLWILSGDDLQLRSIWQINYGVETKTFGWALGAWGGPIPNDFGSAMVTSGQSEFVFASCLDRKSAANVCAFDH